MYIHTVCTSDRQLVSQNPTKAIVELNCPVISKHSLQDMLCTTYAILRAARANCTWADTVKQRAALLAPWQPSLVWTTGMGGCAWEDATKEKNKQ